MEQIDLKSLVTRAISLPWTQFEKDHPYLATLLDQSLVVPHVAELIEDQPEFRRAMRETDQAIRLARVERFVAEFVRRWLTSLA